MSQVQIAYIVLAVFCAGSWIVVALGWYLNRTEPAIYFEAGEWHRNGFKKRSLPGNVWTVIIAPFIFSIAILVNIWQYIAMIAIVVFLLGQLQGCAVNVVVMPDATIQYGSAIDQHVDQSQVTQGQ